MRYRSWLAVVCTFLPSALLADGVVRDGIGAISTGRGGTNLGHRDNGALIHDNPAGIVNVPGQGLFDLSIDTVITDIHYTDPMNDVRADVKGTPIPSIAYIHRDPSGDWAVGVGAFSPAGFSAEYEMAHPVFGPQTKYRSLGALAKALGSAAVRIDDRLSVGASLGVGYSQVELEGPFNVQTGPFRGTPALFDTRLAGYAVAWTVGMQYEVTRDTTVGLAVTGSTQFQLDGQLDARIAAGAGAPLFSRFDAEFGIDWPLSVALGVAHRVDCWNRASVDVIYYNWADAFSGFDLTLTNPDNPVVGGLLGSRLTDRLPANWSDTISTRVGWEFFPCRCTTWRIGYAYHHRPVPAATLNPYTDGVLEHAFNLGYERRLGPWRYNLAYQYSFGPRPEVGGSAIVGGDFDGSALEAAAHWISVAATKTF